MTTVKWLIGTLGLLLSIGGAGQVFAKKSVHHEIIIAAPPEQVWAVIIDLNRYAQWNPALKLIGKLDKPLAVGDTVAYDFTDSEGASSHIKATVKALIPNKSLRQKGGIPGFITYDNHYKLEDLENGSYTKMSIHEEYRGVYVWFWDTTSTEKAYALMNEALAREVMNNQTQRTKTSEAK